MRKHLIITGCTGVGKSTIIDELIELISDVPIMVFSDPYVDNPFLQSAFSGGGKEFQSEMFFFKEFYKIQQQIDNITEGLIIQERSIYECVYIFCRQFLEQKMIDHDEYQLFVDLLGLLSNHIKKPDYIIHVFAESSTIVKRVQKRARSFESTIDAEFVKMQARLYDEWVNKFAVNEAVPLIRLDAEGKNTKEYATKVKEFVIGKMCCYK